MTKNERTNLYNEAKRLAKKAGKKITKKFFSAGSTVKYWKDQIEIFRGQLKPKSKETKEQKAPTRPRKVKRDLTKLKRHELYDIAVAMTKKLNIKEPKKFVSSGSNKTYWLGRIKTYERLLDDKKIGDRLLNKKIKTAEKLELEVLNNVNSSAHTTETLEFKKYNHAYLDRMIKYYISAIVSIKEFNDMFNDKIDDKINTVASLNSIIKKLYDHEFLQMTDNQIGKVINILKPTPLHKFLIHFTFTDERKPITITFGNEHTINFIKVLLSDKSIVSTAEYQGSDIIDNIDTNDIKKVTVERINKPKRVLKNKNGAYFPYINVSSLDLSNYQIYTQTQADDKELYRPQCLMWVLEQYGISMSIINSLMSSYENSMSISKKDFNNIAQKINKNIKLHYYTNTCDKKIHIADYTFDPDLETIHIAIFAEHYFKFELTEYSKYSIDHYDEVKQIKNFKDIYTKSSGRYKSKVNAPRANSLLLVNKLYKKDYFKTLNMSMFPEAGQHEENIFLDIINKEQKPCLYIESKDKDTPIFYADTETYVKKQPHTLQLIGVVSNDDDNVQIFNVNEYGTAQMTVYKFLDHITNYGNDDAICYFHNLKYDYTVLEPYINIVKRCIKDNQYYSVNIIFKGRNILLKDSFKMISFALSKFQSEFDLDKEYAKKEAICYTYYTKENDNQLILTSEYRDLLSVKDKAIFDVNILNEETYDEETGLFNPMNYYKEYLKIDCLVLKKGLLKFEKLVKDLTGISIFNVLTISSLTDKYMIKEGAFEDVYEVCGNLRNYISKAVYGGRVCTNSLFEKQVINKNISDYDGVSLYPSAINRMCAEGKGMPTGKAKRLTNVNTWNDKVYAIMTVDITKVNKIQKMPFIAVKTDTGIDYVNTPPDEPVIIDSITLEDYINFHEIEYTILDGVYWDNSQSVYNECDCKEDECKCDFIKYENKDNRKMGNIIQRLFDERIRQKEQGNQALQLIIKLMLNSAYGKCISKKVHNEKVIKKVYSEHDRYLFENYRWNNYNTIREFRQLNDYSTEIKKICVDNTYNRGHIGAMVLSYSKRIMNELFNVANDNDIDIFYTDTDSLHLETDKIKLLEEKYFLKYNKVLTGKNLGQFHTDFSMNDKDGKKVKDEIHAISSVFLGKKSYIDILESKNEEGKITTGVHYRLKGITKEGIEDAVKKFDGDHLKLYKHMINNEQVFILNPYNKEDQSQKVLFEFKDGQVKTKKEFRRVVSFLDKETKKQNSKLRTKLKTNRSASI